MTEKNYSDNEDQLEDENNGTNDDTSTEDNSDTEEETVESLKTKLAEKDKQLNHYKNEENAARRKSSTKNFTKDNNKEDNTGKNRDEKLNRVSERLDIEELAEENDLSFSQAKWLYRNVKDLSPDNIKSVSIQAALSKIANEESLSKNIPNKSNKTSGKEMSDDTFSKKNFKDFQKKSPQERNAIWRSMNKR